MTFPVRALEIPAERSMGHSDEAETWEKPRIDGRRKADYTEHCAKGGETSDPARAIGCMGPEPRQPRSCLPVRKLEIEIGRDIHLFVLYA